MSPNWGVLGGFGDHIGKLLAYCWIDFGHRVGNFTMQAKPLKLFRGRVQVGVELGQVEVKLDLSWGQVEVKRVLLG